MSWLTSVLSDPSVGTVGSTASRRGTVDLGVIDHQRIGIESLGFGVGNRVFQQISVNSGCLDGPSTDVSRSLALFGLGLATDASGELDKGNDRLEGKDVVQVLQRRLDLHALGVVSNFSAVLEVHSKMGSTSFGSLFRNFRFDTVTDHDYIPKGKNRERVTA